MHQSTGILLCIYCVDLCENFCKAQIHREVQNVWNEIPISIASRRFWYYMNVQLLDQVLVSSVMVTNSVPSDLYRRALMKK